MPQNDRLKGKLVLITGATAGIGKACAIQFAEAGAHLALVARRGKLLSSLAQEMEAQHGIEVTTGVFDIRDRKAAADFVENLPRPVDILVNNAGLAKGVDAVFDASMDDWDDMIDTNVKGLLTMTRLVTPTMREHNKGHVINLGSLAGHEAYAGGSVYCATKHAVKAITEASKKDLHGTQVRVSMVSPGLVETEFSNVRFKGDEERADEVYANMKPLTADDIAEIVLFVAGRPPHVNILDTLVLPVDQSSSSMVARDKN